MGKDSIGWANCANARISSLLLFVYFRIVFFLMFILSLSSWGFPIVIIVTLVGGALLQAIGVELFKY
jgi:hypothetical protein